MTDDHKPVTTSDNSTSEVEGHRSQRPAAGSNNYKIRVKGHLHQRWAAWLGGLTLTHDANGETLLAGSLPDQAALQGVLNQIYALGITLVSVRCSEFDPCDDEQPKPDSN